MKQTAVQWLQERFDKYSDWVTGDHKATEYTLQQLVHDFDKALKMEKEQIVNAVDGFPLNARSLSGEEYYSETFENPNT